MNAFKPTIQEGKSGRIGRREQRIEDDALLRGHGRYADDLAVAPGTLHAAVLRSPHAHARLVGLDASPALAMPGVHAVLTGEDVKRWARPFPVGVRQPMEHWCLAVDKVRYIGEPIAVLLRALEPVEGFELMFRQRPKAKQLENLCSGPAKLAQAMAIDRSLDGTDLTANGDLFIECERRRAHAGLRIGVSGRVGVGYAQEWTDKPLRFFLKGNRHISRP